MNKRERRLEAIRFYNSWKWKKLRYQILTHYGPECMLCGATRHDGRRIVVDHIKPRSTHPELELSFDNCQVLCNSCNKGKSYVDESDFRPDKSGTPTESDTEDDEAPSNSDSRDETFSPEAQFLVRSSKTGRAHLWHDDDTLCHMASTGGLNPRRYRLVGYNPGLPVCTMCRRIARHQGIALD